MDLSLGASSLIILGAPFGSNFSLVESIPVRIGMVIFLILASRQGMSGMSGMSGLLAILAVFTLILERNHELLSKYDMNHLSKPLNTSTHIIYTQTPPIHVNETVHTYEDHSEESNGANDLKDNIPRY